MFSNVVAVILFIKVSTYSSANLALSIPAHLCARILLKGPVVLPFKVFFTVLEMMSDASSKLPSRNARFKLATNRLC